MKTSLNPLMQWSIPPALALLGVATVRWLAPCFSGRVQAILIVVGYVLVPVGLFWFASRLGQRAVDRAAAALNVDRQN